MTQNTKVKICGLSTPETLTKAIEDGADYIGLVFYEPSPRHVSIEVASYLGASIPAHIQIVGLFVNPSDKGLQEFLDAVPLSMIQLHGNETPSRVSEIKEQFKLPVMKAISINDETDLSSVSEFESVADWILFDAKAEQLPGGNGKVFDWNILKDLKLSKPWMLAGGLTADNVQDALKILSPDAVDVSSGVESVKGQKDIDKIASFLERVKSA